MSTTNYQINQSYSSPFVVLYIYYVYRHKNIEQTTPSIYNFLKDHLLKSDPNYRNYPLTHECKYYKYLVRKY